MILPMFFGQPPAIESTHAIRRVGNASGYLVDYNFRNMPDGAEPAGALLPLGGDFYGTSLGGGTTGNGTAFRLYRSGGIYRDAVLYSFTGGGDGSSPSSGLVADSTGAMYGVAQAGGPVSHGAVFKLTPSGKGAYQETTIDSFELPHDGSTPNGVTLVSSGTLFGTTQGGGSNGDGIVFQLAPVGSTYTETILYNFTGGDDGKKPDAPVIADAAGDLYGTTYGGGQYGAGTVFKLTPTVSGYTYGTIYTLQGTYDGSDPVAPLVADKNGTLYGTTYYGGGPAYLGTVFALEPASKGYRERVVYSFQGGLDGAHPATSVTLGPHGVLYGTTQGGGYYGNGVIYALTPSGHGQFIESVLHTFQGYPGDGDTSATALIVDKDNLYGLTSGGGVCACGIFFELPL